MTKINQGRNCKRNYGGNSKARALVAAFAITLTGCASAKVGYYTLVPPQSPAQMSKRLASYDIEVLPVTIPPQIDQSQIVIRRGDGGADVQDLARWTGSPSDQIRQAMSSELTTRLGTRDVTGMSVPAGTNVAKVRINIQRLEFWKDDHVVLDATWQIIHGEKSGKVCEKALKVPSLKGDEQLVHAAQQAIVQLADGIAVTLSRGGC
jgi:uncharacterized lipoprotein YmbA